jgi:hypothetical protein
MSISWENAIEKNETQEFSANPIINKKVKIAVSGLQKTTQKYFIRDIINEKDKELVADFIIPSLKQDSVKPATRRLYVLALAYLCRYLTAKQQKVSLDEVTADMLCDYVDSFRPAAVNEKEEATTAVVTAGAEAEEQEQEQEEGELDKEEARLQQQHLNHQSWLNNQKTLCRPLEKFLGDGDIVHSLLRSYYSYSEAGITNRWYDFASAYFAFADATSLYFVKDPIDDEKKSQLECHLNDVKDYFSDKPQKRHLKEINWDRLTPGMPYDAELWVKINDLYGDRANKIITDVLKLPIKVF